jgi:5'-deoxynucleotidase YfbR-like HD superfamily hydrolase
MREKLSGEKQAKVGHGYMLQIGSMAIRMGGEDRATYIFPNRRENDAEHSYHLSMTAVELAVMLYPELDHGLIAQFANVHDLVEVETGDVPSYNLTPEQREEKKINEDAALEGVCAQLPPYTATLLQRYEEQVEPEARFVRVVDKLLPAIIHTLAPVANRDVFFKQYGITDKQVLDAMSEKRSQQLRDEYPEFEHIHEIRKVSSAFAREKLLADPVASPVLTSGK